MQLGTTEVRFYREISAGVPVRVPAAYHAASDGTEAFVLVLEDLAAAGATFSDVARAATAETAREVVTDLARLHAAFWNSARFRGDLGWLRRPDRNPSLRLERALCAAALRPGLGRFPEVVPEAIRGAAGRIVDARDILDALWAAGDLTLVHGDSHLGNLFFVGGRVGFLDWQVAQVAPGMRDVSYFLVTSLPTEVRRAHERALIAHYLACLAHAGVAAPAFDDAWRQHRLLACQAWVAATVTAAATTLQVEAIARAGVARANRALVDLDSIGALGAIGA
jgi:Ser/Thr protein kinase RdoA (MazF antagonist)